MFNLTTAFEPIPYLPNHPIPAECMCLLCAVCLFRHRQITNTLLTDLSPTRAASVQGASNLIRCLLAGGCIAALEPVTERIGLGWCFGVYAMLQTLVVPLIWRPETKGLTWREELAARQAGEGMSQPA